MNVHCYPVSAASKYVPLLFDGIEDRYQPVYEERSLQPALSELAATGAALVHIHWEEFVLRDCRNGPEADEAAHRFAQDLRAFRSGGGTIVWTVHNELPHMVPHRAQFLALRRLLAQLAHRILVHNAASIDVLAQQTDLDRAKLRLLPHPSYLGRYESESVLRAGLERPHNGRIQAFGWIRLQKGFADLIGSLPTSFLEPRNLVIRVSGHGEEAAAVIAQQPDRTDVEWDVRHVPDEEAAALLRSAACVVLPYERVLTSGVALLGVSVGAILVAVDIPQMRELLPASSRRFLYERGDPRSLRAAIDDVLALPAKERADIVAANLAVARDLHPRIISKQLAAHYASAHEASLATR